MLHRHAVAATPAAAVTRHAQSRGAVAPGRAATRAASPPAWTTIACQCRAASSKPSIEGGEDLTSYGPSTGQAPAYTTSSNGNNSGQDERGDSVASPSSSFTPGSRALDSRTRSGSKPAEGRKESLPMPVVRRIMRAALYGHSPAWRRQGWQPARTARGRYEEDGPYSYLSRDLIERDLTHTHLPDSGVRQRSPMQWSRKGISPSRSRSPSSERQPTAGQGTRTSPSGPSTSSTSLNSGDIATSRRRVSMVHLRGYATSATPPHRVPLPELQVLQQIEDTGAGQEIIDDLAEEQDDVYDEQAMRAGESVVPTSAASDGTSQGALFDKGLRPGDWVQVSTLGNMSSYIYLGHHQPPQPNAPRKALLHSFGNALEITRFEDILFKIPSMIDPDTAALAGRILQLSPSEYYTRGLGDGDGSSNARLPPWMLSDAIVTDAETELTDAERVALWNMYGLEFEHPDWQKSYLAKIECGKALRHIHFLQETFFHREILSKGIKNIFKRIKAIVGSRAGQIKSASDGSLPPGLERKLEYVTPSDVYDMLFDKDDADGESALRDLERQMAKSSNNKASNVLDTDTVRQQRLLAIHSFMLSDSEHYVADHVDLLKTARFRVRTGSEYRCLTTVRDWVRNDDPRLRSFKEKTKRATRHVARHRANVAKVSTKQNAVDEPLKSVRGPRHLVWTQDDIQIIEFIKYFLDIKRIMQINPFEASTSLIIKSFTESSDANSKGEDEYEMEPLFVRNEAIPAFIELRASVIRFLKNIGVFQEWENLVVLERELGLRAWTRQITRANYQGHSMSVEQANEQTGSATVEEGQEQSEEAAQDVEPEEAEGASQTSSAAATASTAVRDELDAVRHDFGSLPVYTIDDPSASELDDGISIEESSILDSHHKPTYWVHTHVADPTAQLRPEDQLSRLTQQRSSSLYFPEMTWPMLPFDVIEKYGWSLGSPEGGSKGSRSSSDNRQGDASQRSTAAGAGHDGQLEQRVFTLSARIDSQGGIVEEAVRAGIVRNVRVITYSQVNEILDPEGEDAGTASSSDNNAAGLSSNTLIWPYMSPSALAKIQASGQDDLAQRPKTPVSPSEVTDLKRLHQLSRLLVKHRIKKSYMMFSVNEGSRLSISPRPVLPNFITPYAPLLYDRQPTLTLKLPDLDVVSSNNSTEKKKKKVLSVQGLAQDMVAEFMVLAGKVAAKSLYLRNLAAPYRGQHAPYVSDPKTLQELLDARDPETGVVAMEEFAKRKITFQPAYFSLTPGDHWPMGITGLQPQESLQPSPASQDGVDGFGYVRATSPLRRYSDLIVHWQLKSTLLPGDQARAPPFTAETVGVIIKDIERTARLRTRMERRARGFWSAYLLQQKLQAVEKNPEEDPFATDLLKNRLTATIGEVTVDSAAIKILAQAKIKELGNMNANLVLDAKDPSQRVVSGQRYPVEIAGVILDEYSKIYLKLKPRY